MVRVIHMLTPSAEGFVPVCGAPADEICSTVQELATCGACRDIVCARLAFLQAAMGEPDAAVATGAPAGAPHSPAGEMWNSRTTGRAPSATASRP
jgi:hypothetical protein